MDEGGVEAGGVEAIREARRELDAVIEEIQAVPGYETFLDPPTFEDVAAAAADCPLVYMTPAEPGGLALIVSEGDVVHVPLDDLTTSELRERVTAYHGAYKAFRADRAAGVAAWNTALDGITAWLWEAAMGPVLDEVNGAGELMLVAGDLLGLLPLHAAWTHDGGRPTERRFALDTAVISYAPNARALDAARRIASRTAATTLLAVIDPQPVSASPIPAAALEGAAAAAAFPGAASVLAKGEATALAFDREAPRADVLHLACHGLARLDEPLESGLLLAGNEWITLRHLFDMRLEVRLAVLSACETSLPGTELPDEVVSLPTGLLQAGVAGVVASQWEVPDLATAILMIEFHRRRTDARPAAALREAQQWVRDRTNGEKLAEWERALGEEAAWLPCEVGDALIDRLAFRDPAARDQAELRAWAGFAHVGV